MIFITGGKTAKLLLKVTVLSKQDVYVIEERYNLFCAARQKTDP